MHARDHVQLAAFLSVHGPDYLRHRGKLSSAGLERFWVHSKCRLDRWGVRLKTHSQLVETGKPSDLPRFWNAVRPVIEEIMIGEVLTRVWMSLCAASDRMHRSPSAEPIARSVFLGHMEARNRSLGLLLHGRGLEASLMVPLNRLRRRTERWTDMLLGYIATRTDVNSFGYDQARVREFAMDIREEREATQGNHSWIMLLESAIDAFGNELVSQPANADLNRDIAEAIMGCFRPGFFDRSGMLQPMWESRIWHVADNAQALVDQLLSLDEPCATQPAGPSTKPSFLS